VLEASIRTDDTDLVFDSLNDFLNIKREPHRRLINKLNNIKHIPDRLYVLLKENFGYSGQMTRRTREFEKPKFRDFSESAAAKPKVNHGKRHKPKGPMNPNMAPKNRKAIHKIL
jgi:hypothetical protein